MALGVFLLLIVACSGGSQGDREELRVMPASSLTDAFEELAQAFEDSSTGAPFDVELTVAGSATLATQLHEGASADVVATANTETMGRILALSAPLQPPKIFASNSLVLVTPSDNPGQVTGPEDLGRQDLLISVCNQVVPCGRLTIEAAGQLGVLLAPDTFEANVRAVLTKVELGEVDAGLVYRTDALGRDVQTFELALDSSVRNRYPIFSLTESPGAAAFVDFVLSPAGQEILADHGFARP